MTKAGYDSHVLMCSLNSKGTGNHEKKNKRRRKGNNEKKNVVENLEEADSHVSSEYEEKGADLVTSIEAVRLY